MRPPALAALALALLPLPAAGCRAGATVLSAEAPDPSAARLVVRVRVTGLGPRQDQCRVVADFAGHAGEAPVPMTEGAEEPETVTTTIAGWTPEPGAPAERVQVRVLLRGQQIARAQFPPPWDPAVFAGVPRPASPAGSPPPPAPAATDARHPDAAPPPAAATDAPPPAAATDAPPPATPAAPAPPTTDAHGAPAPGPGPDAGAPGPAAPCPHCGRE